MRDIPSIGMVRVFNVALLNKMKIMGVEKRTKHQMGSIGEKYYTKARASAYIQRVDRTRRSDGLGPELRHFFYWKDGQGQLIRCVTDEQLKSVIRKLDVVEREYFFIKYVLSDKCSEFIGQIDFENPELLRSSIVQSVDNYLDARYRNCDHLESFTSENITKWKIDDEKLSSSYNYIRIAMITKLVSMVNNS
tara:strand:+ start:60 stop:635 length:576 start_codon:yes stop_codon:yes gene_type:complete